MPSSVLAFLLTVLVGPTLVAAGYPRRFSAMSSAVVTIKRDDSSFFGSSAYDEDWAAPLPPQTVAHGQRPFYPLVYTTAALVDPFGCSAPPNASASATLPPNGSFVLLLDRGRCTFAQKAVYAQALGAVALIVTDTQQQAYNRTRGVNATSVDREMEYSCKNGRGEAPAGVELTAFETDKWRDAVNVPRCTASSSCDSSMCIPTGKGRQVCCLWDVADAMSFSSVPGVAESGDDVTIPVVRLKIMDGDMLKLMLNATSEELLVTLYKRDPPLMDPSQFIIWLIALFTVMTGGYKGATLERERALRKQSATLLNANAGAITGDFSPRSIATASGVMPPASNLTESVMTTATVVDPATAAAEQELLDDEDDETMDLNIYHAFGFVIFATVFLLILFYWNIVIVVIIFFAVGSVSCTFQVLWQPLFERVSFLRLKPFAANSPTGFLAKLEPETWMIADIVALVWSLAVSIIWFIYRNRQYAWLLQDLFGVCLCILFLRTIRLPNLKIATFMLVLVFLYDIFMVFISPYIFHESVMIKAATGGSQAAATVSDGYCLRYPHDTKHNCLKEQMPILLRFPKVIDWRDGQSMLGLGDIVLPGLLVVFCARFDYATRGQLMGRVKAPHLARLKSSHHLDANADLSEQQQLPELTSHNIKAASRRGLFGIMMWGYAIGLLLANIGVMLMKQGQPALMYLVPCTLGTLMLVAWRRGIVRKLWEGPEEFRPQPPPSAPERAMMMRDRGFTMDHVSEGDNNSLVMITTDITPQSTYSRPEDTPKSNHQRI